MIYGTFGAYGQDAPPGAVWPQRTPQQETGVAVGGLFLLIGGLALAAYLYDRAPAPGRA